MSLIIGTRLGIYEIIAPLGAGGMGEVYRARDTKLGRDVAIKVLPESVSRDAVRRARFEREARAVAALNHPNIVVLHSIEQTDSVHFLTLELVEGRTLDQLIETGGLPLGRLLGLAVPLADALAAAHERGVVHRDLKPGNVMVTREERVKVLDFGLARMSSDDAGLMATQAATIAAPISEDGSVVGTIPYMSPEQLRGARADARSDLFSLGVILYELASGRRPFEGATSAEVSSAILRDAPRPLSVARAGLPPDLERIVERCLEKDPERRFQTAKDVRNELERLRRSLDSTAARPAAQAGPVAEEVPSIAVLTFENRSHDEEDAYFAEGLADELVAVLGKIRGLRVAARSSSRQAASGGAGLAEIGRILNVATVLEGSMRKAGNRVRIAVHLVNPADGFPLWSETYDRTLHDIFAVQDDIAQSVVKELRARLLGRAPDSRASSEARAEVAAAAAGRGRDPEAHRLFLQGRFLYSRLSPSDLLQGIDMLTRAVARDPEHALAWATLGLAYPWAGGTGVIPVDEGMQKGRAAAMRALTIEPNLAEGHTALGLVQHWYDHEWAKAEASFGRALELAPGSADALRSIGMLEYCLGRHDRALDLMRRSIEADPLANIGPRYVALIHWSSDEFIEADAAFRALLELTPSASGIHGLRAVVLLELGRSDEALAEASAEEALWSRCWSLAIVHWAAGRRPESDAALAELERAHTHDASFQIACVRAFRGEIDAAFEALDRALATHDAGVPVSKVTPQLRPLHNDPRWPIFLRRIGLEP